MVTSNPSAEHSHTTLRRILFLSLISPSHLPLPRPVHTPCRTLLVLTTFPLTKTHSHSKPLRSVLLRPCHFFPTQSRTQLASNAIKASHILKVCPATPPLSPNHPP